MDRNYSMPDETWQAAVAGTDIHDSHGERMKSVNSRIVMWFLVRFGGYRVVLSKQTPRTVSMGRIRYKRVWHLRKK